MDFSVSVTDQRKYVKAGELAGRWAQIRANAPAAAQVPERGPQTAAAGDRDKTERGAGEEDSSQCSPFKRCVK